MGGTNPYIEKAEVELPKKAYKITFRRPDGPPIIFEVDPSKLPYGPTGLPGSILDIALNGGASIDLEHACGGVCACSRSMLAPPLSAMSRMLPGRPVGPYGSLLGSTSNTMGGPSGLRKVTVYAFFGSSTSAFSIYGLVPPTLW